MKEMKKILVLFFCLLFALVLMVTGCSKNDKSGGNVTASRTGGTDDAESLYSAPGVLPIVNKPVTLSIFAPTSPDIPRAESDMTKWMEEITGIHVEWQIAASDAYKEKMQLLLASGDYPDMIVPGVGSRIDKTVEQQLGIQGIIIPLTEFYDTISVGYKEAFEKLPGMREYMTAQDGNIYSMPNVDGALQMQYQNKLWINTEWLRAVGKTMPTTLEEFYDVLKAFKEQDANRNGDPNDEIPFSSAGSSVLDVFLMNPFILTPATDRMWVNNGKIVFSVTDPAYKEGVRYLAKLYAEGLMNPELFTWNATTQVNTNENGDVPVLGSVLAQRPGNFCSLSGYPDHSRKWEQYYPAAPFKMVNGSKAVTNWNAYAATFQTGVAMITNACKYPEAAFRMVDLLATPEMTIITTNGPKGQGWREAVEGEVGLNGAPAKYTIVSADRPKNWGGWDQLMGRVQTPEYLASLTYNPNPYAPEVDPMQGRHIVLYRSSLEYQKVSQSLESVLPPLYFLDAVMDEYSLLKTNINAYVEEMLVAFVTGAKNIDRDWDSYMHQLNTLGLVRYLEIMQETYDASAFAQ
jgi:putative aldouronate transport system substrate-binding protein